MMDTIYNQTWPGDTRQADQVKVDGNAFNDGIPKAERNTFAAEKNKTVEAICPALRSSSGLEIVDILK